MPAAICSIASVIMKLGMPIRVSPKAFTAPSAKHAASAISIAAQPGSGTFAIVTLASCAVKYATTMPVALAMLATDRSISAHRITNVSPTAIIPVTEICVRMFSRLPSVAKESLAAQKKPTSTSSVAKGATLRSRPCSQSTTPLMRPPAIGPC